MTGMDDHEKPRYTTRRLRYEIDEAVKRERERCAAICDDHAKTWGLALGGPAKVLAEAIRKGE